MERHDTLAAPLARADLPRSRALRWLGALGLVLALGACGGNGGDEPAVVTLTGITVTPANLSLAKGSTQQYAATGTYSDSSTHDITSQVNWTSSDPAKATIGNGTNKGQVATLSEGSTIISAALGSVTGSTGLVVTGAQLRSLSVTPTSESVPAGFTTQYQAIGSFSDNTTQDLTTQVNWLSSDTGKATISNAAGSKGEATGVAAGPALISATLGSVTSNTAALAVTNAVLNQITVTPANPSLALGRTLQMVATGTFDDNSTRDITRQVTWASSTPTHATVGDAATNKGVVTTVAPGGTTLSATRGTISGSTLLTVTPATLDRLDVTPASTTLAKGFKLQYTAIGTFSDHSTQDLTSQANWAVSVPAVASVSNTAGSKGEVQGLSAGATEVSAIVDGVGDSASLIVTNATLSSLAVTPANATIALGTTQQYVATGTFSDATTQPLTTQVAWSSSDPAKATISNAPGSRGLATSHAIGTTQITATLGGQTASTGLTVSPAALASIAVLPANANLPAGFSRQYSATGTFTDGTTQDVSTQVTWASTETNQATISNAAGSRGLASAPAGAHGVTNITATLNNVTGSTPLNVTSAQLTQITVTPANANIAVGFTRQYAAQGTFNDGTSLDLTRQVTWSTSDPTKATISNADADKGLASGVSSTNGTPIDITATHAASGVSGSTPANVIGLSSITVTPANTTKGPGQTQQYTATGTFSNGGMFDITTSVTWTSSAESVATISNAPGSQGLATTTSGPAPGSTTITATRGGTSGTASLLKTP